MKVLVTGAGGHLGYNLVQALLDEGHTVRASIRTTKDAAAVARLQGLGPVEVVGAQLEDGAELRAAMEGVDIVFHTAAVYLLYAPGRDDEIVKASTDGVERALLAAKDAKVGRVILTSSVVTLPLRTPGAPPATEADWNEDLRVPYFRAKTVAEQKAWALARDHGIDLVSVLPAAFAGPGFIRPTPTVDLIASIMNKAMDIAAPPGTYPYVDVRDVARAHVLAMAPAATGRYLVINEPIPTFFEIAKLMHAIDPAIPSPKFELPQFTMRAVPLLDRINSWMGGNSRSMTPEMAATLAGKRFNATAARARADLGWKPEISLRQSLADTISTLRALRTSQAA
ncbi:MAG: NAD-dependent epimerase/dehydratase family protein [Hyphomicrobiaceae bacterium]